MLRAVQNGNRQGQQKSGPLPTAASIAGRQTAQPQNKLMRLQTSYGNQGMLKLFSGGILQRKLTINQPGDAYEQEADRMADAVMRMPDPASIREPSVPGGTNLKLQRCSCGKSSGTSGECEECNSMKLQRGATSSSASTTAPPIVHDVLSSPGQPLDAATRGFMEPRFGHDFSGVRVHTDAKAAESARAVNALAYAVGQDVVFGAGQYAAGSGSCRRLVAHELAHVVQQSFSEGAGIVQRSVQEANFPGGGKVDDVRSGEHLVWNFDVGVTILKPEHLAQMPRLAAEIKQALTRDPKATVDVEGEASLTGPQARNDELSKKRAEAVKEALIKQGVTAERINTVAIGSLESLPAASQENLARSRAVRVRVPAHLLLPAGPSTVPPQPGPCQARLAPTNIDLAGDDVHLMHRLSGFVHIQTGSGSSARPAGMEFLGSALLSPDGCGTFMFVQNTLPLREIVYKDHSRNTFQSSSYVLDSDDPYGKKEFAPKGPMALFMTNDSPSQPIDELTQGRINSVEVRDDYRMFILFQPTGEARRVLQVGEWSFTALAKTDTPSDLELGKLVLDNGVSRVEPHSAEGRFTTDVPVTSPNVIGLNWTTNNGGKTGESTADTHRKILDKLKPKASP